MKHTEIRSTKAGWMDDLLKWLDCLGKVLQIVKTGLALLKHLN